MNLKQTIEEIVEKHLPDDSHFIVEIQIKDKGPKKVLNILIDGDQGVNIESCAAVSRAVGEELEAKQLIDGAYVMEVSSPGLDYPLGSRRQYQKNVGRSMRVHLQDGKELEGKLAKVGQTEIVLLVKKKEKGKKAAEEEVSVAFEQIKKSIVLVSFK
ncbi:ribosome maturation factor RimP [Negadavirga shengliensis]|uniref:Ribosome maturation factor RimP n=1 Tax=Negadavirga shengliensis TaxID=1389218 RepID=A0ABV9SVC7_9BACT